MDEKGIKCFEEKLDLDENKSIRMGLLCMKREFEVTGSFVQQLAQHPPPPPPLSEDHSRTYLSKWLPQSSTGASRRKHPFCEIHTHNHTHTSTYLTDGSVHQHGYK